MNEEQFERWIINYDPISIEDYTKIYDHCRAAWNESARIHTMLERERCLNIIVAKYPELGESVKKGR